MMPKKQDVGEFKEVLDKGVILVAGDGDVIDLDDPEPVRVAIMFDVNGFGPHVGAIWAMQRGHVDEALEAADELLEEWTLDHYPDVDPDNFTETFDGRTWTLSVEDFAEAIKGTAVEKFIEVAEDEEEENLEEGTDPVIEVGDTIRAIDDGDIGRVLKIQVPGEDIPDGVPEYAGHDGQCWYWVAWSGGNTRTWIGENDIELERTD